MWDKILVMIGLDATQFEAGAKRVESSLKRLGANIGGDLKTKIAGAFAVGSIVAFTKRAIDAANKIQDLADNFQMTTDEVQQLKFAADQVGSSIEKVAGGMDKLAKAREDAIGGNEDLAVAFANVGVNLLDLQDKSKSTLDLFKQMGAAFNGGGGGRSDLMKIFGRSGGELASVLKSFNQSNGEGIFFQSEDIKAIDEFTESINKASEQVMGFWASLGVGLAKGLSWWEEFFTNRMAAGGDVSREGKPVSKPLLRQIIDPLDLEGGIKAARGKGTWNPFELIRGQGGKRLTVEELRAMEWESRNPVIPKKQQEREAWRKAGDAEFAKEMITTKQEADLQKEIAATEQLRLDIILKASTKQQQRFQLETRELELQMKIAELQSQNTPDALMKAEKLKQELLRVQGEKAQLDVFTGKVEGISPDSLAKIGGFVGGAASVDSSLVIASQSLAVLKSIDKNISKITDSSKPDNLNNVFVP